MGRGGFYFDVVAAVVRRWGDYLLEEGRDSGAGLFGDSRIRDMSSRAELKTVLSKYKLILRRRDPIVRA